ncbi:hemerythrin domain-containing protein [Rhodococcus sp. BP-349]|uniref:hemerythrin domain-containing protein n=1 Tax=unclassified Rhodococcus (in: high G+C Gram-positive bacteria) TaxID=192944 RepID=UPI001C9ACE26|nr:MULTISPECIES: hemerythrin domain-containing protein [unclassified Rhodococcus (in: high G+C Gram-positive bacteria)]MBY6537472.1 hemerythrin domain-containing protein [Rhodococcus sp. BP-363]MBY6541809.1 hemerythrin domain-containing protein [Rhodococcus sp. BP-369]MBY6561039.1 hemerythrin domain-containing protein [Rhodococcus sp. BP-370]MBY6575331.1 hemerythrin domain-containing protein [Rhodococcus sp. BP-364]MBY6584632.1 hemerythrin domain-containing protein [Rhodococcus sp. BP-358]
MTDQLPSIATASVAELGGRTSVLTRQRDDHIELDQLLHELGETPAADRADVLNRICRLVFPHAFAEESVLWPAIRKWVPDGESLTLEIEREHQEINELFSTLEEQGHGTDEGSALLDRIVVLLREDVRDEEDRLFPMLRRAMDDAQLRRLGVAWIAVRRTAPTRPHPVVARRPPGNVVAALPLTVLDRSRDALDVVSRRVTTPSTVQLLQRTSGLLATVAGAVEHVPPLTRGEDPSTRSGRTTRPE